MQADFAMTGRPRPISLVAIGATLVVAFVGSSDAFAHSGHQPLFVAENGTDKGLCLNERAPCRTIGYALSVAGKGAEIQIAAGSYAIEDAEDLFHIVSGTVKFVGGFKSRDGFSSPGSGITTLTGVPFEFRGHLEQLGFNVVADRKGIEGALAAETAKLLGDYAKLQSGAAPAGPCAEGMAGLLPCDSVDLLSQLALDDVTAAPAAGSDVWGFVELNSGREYVIAGYDIGTAVVDVTNPEAPVEVGFVSGERTTWRDIKVYQFFDAAAERWHSFAYVTADAAADGLVIIDLGGLPHAIRKIDYASDFVSAHNVYMTNVDYSTGLALTDSAPLLAIAGSNIGSGEYRTYSLADPAAPVFVGGASTPDYIHDASSIVIADERKDTQCVNGGEVCEVLLDFNESTFDVWDISDAANPARLSSTPYANSGYVHSGWWTEDKQFVLVHDEQDEQRLGLNTTVRVFSIADLASPVLVGTWTGPTRAIDHNGFVRGNRYYISNYSHGLTILDITDPAAPTSVGFLDTYPASDESTFVGAWGTYPFFFSNTIAIGDINTGLYLARDKTIDVPQGRFSFSTASAAADETQTAQVTVRRIGGSSGDVSVDIEILDATTADADYQPATANLHWLDGDSMEKAIDIPLVNDGAAEGMERLFVRLVDPRGGATLGDINVASVYLSDPGATAAIGFFEESIEVTESGFSKAVVVLRRSGSALGAASVDYSVAGGTAIAGSDYQGSSSGSVTWPEGDGTPKNLVFDIQDDGGSESDETFEVTVANPQGADLIGSATLQVTILGDAGENPPEPVPDTAESGGGSFGGWFLSCLVVVLCGRSRFLVLRRVNTCVFAPRGT